MRSEVGWKRLLVVTVSVIGLLSAARALGFADGVVLGATPASGMALGAAIVLRAPGAAAAAAGFLLAGLGWGLPPGAAIVDAAAHGAAALAAARLMRGLARARRMRSRTSDWLIFLAGVAVFATTVALGLAVGSAAGLVPPAAAWLPAWALAFVFEPFGIFTFCAVLASLGELPRVRADPLPALGIAAVAVALLVVQWSLLSLPLAAVNPSGVTLLLSVPFCLMIAMQRRSLDGAAIALVAAHAALLILLGATGGITRTEFVTGVIYLNLLIATCQLVHAINLDRLAALAEVDARKHELEQRVEERTARLSAMTERALAADAAKTRFMATVSHEVRTPLNGVLGMASVILAGDIDERTRRNVGIIRTSGFHLLDIINRILDYARLDHPLRPEDISAFDLEALVDEVLQEARFLPYAGSLDLRAEVAPGLALTRRGYRQGLRQILTNFVGNAAKFTERGSVTVRLSAGPGDMVRLEVEDTGVGIDAAALERIFQPFEQAGDKHARRQGGTGLGLAICAELAKRLGGRIGVQSEPGRGSRFWFEVPLPAATVAQPKPRARATGA